MKIRLFVPIFVIASCANSDKAEGHAFDWAAEFYPEDKLRAVECEISDSDGDGRVRCTLGFTSGQVEFLDCPSDWTPQPFTTKCVSPKATQTRRRR